MYIQRDRIMSRCPVRVPFAITDLSVRVAIRPGSGSRAARGALLVWLVHIMRRAPGVPVATGVFWHLWVVAWVARAVAARALVLRRGGAFKLLHDLSSQLRPQRPGAGF